MRLSCRVLLSFLCLFLVQSAFAQTNPTGTISGRVVDQQGLALPGVSVTASSPALQGNRTTTTSANGDFILPFLPPGDYTIDFELTGFATVKRTERIAIGQTLNVAETLAVSALTETVTVTGQTEGEFGTSAQVATSFKQDLVEKLALNRTLQAVTQLTPGVQGTGPGGNVVVNGAMSFESLYLVNGVVVNENLRGQPQNLFIEDALQETTISTASVSAEYGRFQGGVVQAVTKSGSNQFSGSFRTTFDNDKWRSLTAYEEERLDDGRLARDPRLDDTIPTLEATLGGPILKDRLWFFGAYRGRNLSEGRSTSFTNVAYTRELKSKRYEGKLTWSVTPNHTFKGAYTKIDDKENGNTFGTIMDLASVVNRELPNDLLSLNYTGILSPKFFIEAQYSRREFAFVNSGSQFTDLIQGTLLLDRSRSNSRYNSPTFCGVCDDETRDNQNLIAKASYFLSTSSSGSHNFVGGVDVFDDKRFANNHQSGSDYRIFTTSSIIQGQNVIPVLDQSTFIRWTPIFVGSEGNRFRTLSFFLNDQWTLNSKWSFNLGLRYDKNDGQDSQGVVRVKDSAFSPRLSATFDPRGDGKLKVNASYAQYVAAIANNVGDGGSSGGQPATIDFDYLGPAVNTGNPANPVPTDQALQTLWDWFFANGGTDRPTRGNPSIPGVNTTIGDGLKSPNVQEFVVGFALRLGERGSLRADGVFRKFKDFYASRVDLSTGQVQDEFGRSFDVVVTENSQGDDLERSYKGLNLQINYPIGARLNLGGNWTLSETKGNVEGETGASGPGATAIYSYPEYFDAAWSYPSGELVSSVRHKVRAWATYDVPIPESAGRLSLGALQYFNSGTPYAYNPQALPAVDTRPFVANPGYATPPATRPYFFEARDTYKTEDLWQTDLSLNYSYRLSKVDLFFRGTVNNLFDRSELTNFYSGGRPGAGEAGCGTGGCIDTTIQTNNNSSTLARFNPFTETPVEGVNWRKGTAYGQATSRFAFQTPRTWSFSVGVRF